MRIFREKILLGAGQEMCDITLGNIVEYKECKAKQGSWSPFKSHRSQLEGTLSALSWNYL